jgi:inner membrane protein
MMWRTHVLFGMSSLWLLAPVPAVLTNHNVGPLCALAAFGALLPDLDAEESKVKSLSWKGIRPFAPLAQAVHRTWGHRGLLHSPLGLGVAAGGAILLALLGYGLPALALWLGYASHLAADACTKTGIPGWPNRPERRLYLLPRGWRFVTGSMAEETLLPLLALAVMALLLSHYPPT